MLFLLPGILRIRGREPLGPLFAAPLVSLLFWGAFLPAAGLLGVAPGFAAWLGLAAAGAGLGAGFFEFRRIPRGKEVLLPAGLALLFLGLRLLPLGWAVGPPGAEPAFHAFLARRVLECGGWPADLSPQIPGIRAGGFAGALSFSAAAWADASGGGIRALPGLFLLQACLAQWALDVGFLALGTALAGPAAGGAAALILGLASPFPQDVAGWGGTGNLLALAAGCLLLAERIRGRRGWKRTFFLAAAAGAAHPLGGILLLLALFPDWIRSLRSGGGPSAAAGILGVLLFSGILPMVLLGPEFSRPERVKAAAWGLRTGPCRADLPAAALPAAPALAARRRMGAGAAGLALAGILLGLLFRRIRRPGFMFLVSTLPLPWIFAAGIPGRLLPVLGLVYPERAFLWILPAFLAGTALPPAALSAWVERGGKGRRALEGLLALGLALWAVRAVRVGYGETYLGRVLREGVLAPSDLDVLFRMDRILPAGAVVETRPDDAGLWVPALAGRRATCFHLTPPLFQEGRRAAASERAGFLFRGARPNPGLGREWTTCPGGTSGPVRRRRVLLRRGRTLLLER